MTTVNEITTVQQVLSIVKEDPGVSARHIADQLGDVTRAQVTVSLQYLRRTNQIVNRGKHGQGASWYPTRPDQS